LGQGVTSGRLLLAWPSQAEGPRKQAAQLNSAAALSSSGSLTARSHAFPRRLVGPPCRLSPTLSRLRAGLYPRPGVRGRAVSSSIQRAPHASPLLNSTRTPPLSPIPSSVRFFFTPAAAAELRSSAAADLCCQLAPDRLNCLSLSLSQCSGSVSSPFLPLSPCIFISSNGALEVEVGELQHAGHGATVAQAAGALFQCPLSLSISAGFIFSRWFLIQWPRSTETLSMPILQLHPYNYFSVNPRSFARFTVYVSFFRKRIFVRLD